ncbi:MAG: serine/threonine protein kinase [Sandarakinorhabdus sp.]|nr:serine/threonine protein kinase [Sandarakinorhabdus sp.]
MGNATQRAVLDLFEAWLEAPPDRRDADLAAQLHDRPAMLAAIHRLIAAQDRAGLLPTEPPTPTAMRPPLPPPDRVGAYRLVRPIGSGGMGLVFEGERDDGVYTRSVAIKLIRRGLFSARAAAQFAAERQMLARLRHPHIAQLFDGGVTPEGESFIVMELITGLSITDHCRRLDGHLDRRARIALMRDVCDAVQFAHQQLIVHADIKPNNIVVDADYGVKLLDFGIARMIGDPDDDAPRAQTPAFSSPQQAAGAAPTPADDIFALGRVIIALTDDAPVDHELDAVINCATAPLPNDRYGTASALSADLERWLLARPVKALPNSQRRTARMFVRRHWLGVGTAALALLALVAAATISTTLYLRAETARRQAEVRFGEVRQLSGYLLTDVTGALQRFPGTSALRHDLADRGRIYLETLARIPGAPLDMRLEVARGYATTASILGQPGLQSLGDPRAAKRDLAIAEPQLRRLLAETHGRSDVALAMAQALTTHAAIAHVTDNNPRLGARLFEQACDLARPAAAARPADANAYLALFRCQLGLANLYDYEGRYAEIVAPLDAAVATLNRLDTAVPATAADAVDRALGRGNALILRGDTHYYTSGKGSGLPWYRAAVDALAAAQARYPDGRLLERLAWAEYCVGSVLRELGAPTAALVAVEKGVVAADLMTIFETSPRAGRMATILHMERATTLGALRRFGPAITEAQATMVRIRDLARRYPDDYEAARWG